MAQWLIPHQPKLHAPKAHPVCNDHALCQSAHPIAGGKQAQGVNATTGEKAQRAALNPKLLNKKTSWEAILRKHKDFVASDHSG